MFSPPDRKGCPTKRIKTINRKECIYMKSLAKKSLAIAVILSAAGMAGVMLARAQQTATPVQGDATSLTEANVDWSSASDLEVMLQAVESVPPAPASSASRIGTFYSAQHAPGTRSQWPPLPGNFYRVPVWNLGDGVYLLDDLQIDYADSAATATTMTMSANAKPMGQGLSPAFSTQNGPWPYLTIAPTGTNQLLITVINTNPAATYYLQMTPVLANSNYPWTTITNGVAGQTNFTVNIGPYADEFFWAFTATNNPGQGVIAVFIDSPANGATVQ
jgi:hypothetical protein